MTEQELAVIGAKLRMADEFHVQGDHEHLEDECAALVAEVRRLKKWVGAAARFIHDIRQREGRNDMPANPDIMMRAEALLAIPESDRHE